MLAKRSAKSLPPAKTLLFWQTYICLVWFSFLGGGSRLIHQRLLNLQRVAAEAEERHCVGGDV